MDLVIICLHSKEQYLQPNSEVDSRQAHVESEKDVNSRARGVSLEYS